MGNVCSFNPIADIVKPCWDLSAPIRSLQDNLESLRSKMGELDRVYNDVNQKIEEARSRRWVVKEDADGWLKRVQDVKVEVYRMISTDGPEVMGSYYRCSFCYINCRARYRLSRRAEKRVADLVDALSRGRELSQDRYRVASEPTETLDMTLASLLEKIGRKKARLDAVFKDVKGKVEDGKRRHEEPTNQVDLWMKDAHQILQDVEQFLGENHGQGTSLWAVDSSQSDQRNAELQRTIWHATLLKASLDQKLKDGRNFGEVTCKPMEPVIRNVPLDPPVGGEYIFVKVWNWVEDESVRCIGIFGMGGVGKTTLLDRVHNHFAQVDHDYDFAVRIVVSRPLDLDKIQDSIWSKLNLSKEEWNKHDRIGRAALILSKMEKKNFLLFLDDLWDKIDLLKDVGIPRSGSNHRPKKCKIIFTTRDERVCEKMKPDRKMKVECLPQNEARELFKRNVGERTWYAHPIIPKIAEELVDECKNLPLAIITVAAAMSGTRQPRDWMEAKMELKTRSSIFQDMEREVLDILKFSYDRLPDETHRRCFLYLSIFPEDENISEDYVIRLWIGESFVQKIDDGTKIWKRLRQASLLEFVERSWGCGEIVKMHDLVREMAMWVYSERGQNENREFKKWNITEMTALWRTESSCRYLSTLILKNMDLRVLEDEFFTSKPQLRILDIRVVSLRLLPPRLPFSVWKLSELRYLNLDTDGVLGNKHTIVEWREIENMRNLEVLILSRGLRLSMGENTEAAKSNLSSLRIFHWYGTYTAWGIDPKYQQYDEMKVLEVLLMQNMMEDICVTLCASAAVAKLLKESPKLHSHLRRMSLVECDGLISLEFSTTESTGFKRLQSLILKCRVRDIKVDNKVSFDGLRNVSISVCHKLKDLTQLIYHAPILERLQISFCDEMTKVIDEGDTEDSHVTTGSRPFFSCLEILEVSSLPSLKSICTRALPFPSLKEVTVLDCPELKMLPLDGNSAKDTLRHIYGEQWWWDSLVWEDPTSKKILSRKFVKC